MQGVFISYRREDSAPYAGRIFDYLRRAFPSTSIFMDVGAIKPGADFVKDIDRNLLDSAVVLAVIGPHWHSVQDDQGRRRLENPGDYVVRELATALERKAQVIPLLVGGARMPPVDSLPPALSELSRRNAMEVDDARFDEDAERICQAIAGALGIDQDEQVRKRREYGRFFTDAELASAGRRFHRVVWAGFGLLLLYMFLAMGSQALSRSGSAPETAARQEAPRVDCRDASIKTDEQYTACRAVNAAMANAARAEGWLEGLAAALGVLFCLFLAWVNVKLLRGRNWARVVHACFTGVLCLAVFGMLTDLSGVMSFVILALYLAVLAAYAWASRMMFTDPIRRRFVRLE